MIHNVLDKINERMDELWEKLPDAYSDTDGWTHEQLMSLGEYKALEWVLDFIEENIHECK